MLSACAYVQALLFVQAILLRGKYAADFLPPPTPCEAFFMDILAGDSRLRAASLKASSLTFRPRQSLRCGKSRTPRSLSAMKARDGRGSRQGEKPCRNLSPPLNSLA